MDVSDDKLRGCLQRILEDVFHERSPITRIDAQLSDYSSSFASYIISIRSADGLEKSVFLKDYGCQSRPVQQLEDRRNRELQVYRKVLAEAGLGTAQYYGSLWDESQESFWLFLEFVDGTPVGQSGFDRWLDAARWLGRMHEYSLSNAEFLEGRAFLLRHDRQLFQGTAEAAHVAVAEFSSELAARLSPIVSGYHPLVEAMTSHPPVLVHGSYSRNHVLLDRGTQPPRLCPVDWESAALGAGLFDLAYLAEGFISPQLDEFIDVYRDEVGKHGTTIPPEDEVVYLMNCYSLHRNLKWLSWAWDEEFPLKAVSGLVSRAERLARLVL